MSNESGTAQAANNDEAELIAPYLQKDFGVELNYKLWTTKGARFAASHRNKIQNELSSKTLGYLSAYLTIVSLLTVYKIPFEPIGENYLNFTITALSILILIFSQFETAKEFSIKSERFHQCSLEIGELYNELRIAKTFPNILDHDRFQWIIEISKKYDKVLQKYENHDSIDFDYFKTFKKQYFKLTRVKFCYIKLKHYFFVRFKYHLFIYGPGLFLGIAYVSYLINKL